MTSYSLSLVSALGSDLQFLETQASDSLVISINPPLVSLDTLLLSLNEVTDLSGLVAEEMKYEFPTELWADYTADLAVDVNDLVVFVDSWERKDYSGELGPVTGKAPHFVPEPDSTYNLRDVMTFTRMWHWWHQQPQPGSLVLTRLVAGVEPEVIQSGQNLIVRMPDEVMVARIAFQYPPANLNLTTKSMESTPERMILSAARPDQGELLVDMGSLGKKGSREIVFNTEHFTRENSKVMVTYIMFSEDQEVAGQGTRIMELKAIPEEFSLHQNYPNPFNPYTTILYDLPQDSRVKLVVYDILGREVATLVNGKKPAGYYSLRWNGRDDSGRPLASGLYIYRISARGSNGGTYSKVRKMILLK